MPSDELLNYLFDRRSHALEPPMAGWLASSRRFSAFVLANRTKIRKKIRSTREPEALRDLQLEIETACLLLRERSLSLAYEPVHPHEGRSPDFAVSYTTSLVFMLEVTRLRGGALPEERFTDLLCRKLGQMLPQAGNALLIGVEGAAPPEGELRLAMLRIRQRAEQSDPALVERHGFRDRADFFRQYQRLSAVLVRSIPLEAGAAPAVWENPQAGRPLPPRVRLALMRSQTL